jgi:hypothetical protein
MRDDFTSKDKETMAKRVGYHCSNPTCQKLTIGPNRESSKTVNIGVAAHITAAASGGPRYDLSLSPEQRSSLDNGIWLCQSCSKLIDSDPDYYRVITLKEWKANAENKAKLQIEGKDRTELSTKQRPLKRPVYLCPAAFIQRQVTYNTILAQEDSVASEIQNATLTELFSRLDANSHRRIVLQSEAGVGKTTELAFVAYYFSVDPKKRFYPILLTLNDYTNHDIAVLLNEIAPDWKGLNESELLLILDGLDEVKTEERDDFIRRVRFFITAHSSCNVLLSSRTNFSANIDQFQGFQTYTLHEFSEQEIQDYVRKHNPSRVESFMQLINERGFIQWLRNPFSLTHFVTFFEDNPTTVPQSRIELLRRIETLHLSKDISRLQADDQYVCYVQLIRKLAFAMSLLGVNTLSERQKVELFPNTDDRNRLKNVSFVQITTEQTRFNHNILQEYFTASVLAENSFEQIKACIAFSEPSEELKPKWLNTVGILLELVSDQSTLQNLLILITRYEPQLLLSVEYKHFSKSLRLQAFRSILHHPNHRFHRNLRYNSQLTELADISHNPDVLEYLLNTIEGKDEWLQAESLFYLRQADAQQLFGYRTQIKNTLRPLLFQQEVRLQELVIEVITALKLHTAEFERLLTESVPNLDNFIVRDRVYRYLNQFNRVDDYIDFYVAGFEFYTVYRSKETGRHGGIDVGFIDGLKLVKTAMGLHQLIDYLIANLDFIKNHKNLFRKRYKSDSSYFSVMAVQLAECYEDDESFYQKALSLFEGLYELHEKEYAHDFTNFFRLTGTGEQAFYDLLPKDGNFSRPWALGWVAEEAVVINYARSLTATEIQPRAVWAIVNGLYFGNKSQLAEAFLVEINKISEVPFQEDTRTPTKQQLRDENDLMLLLDQQAFIDKVADVFNFYESDTLSNEQLWAYRRDLEEADNEVAIRYLNCWFIWDEDLQCISQSRVVDYLRNTCDWDDYSVGVLIELFLQKQNLARPHIDKILSWCYAQLPNINFRTALIGYPDGGWSYKPLEHRMAQVFMSFDFAIPESILLDMLSFDGQTIDNNEASEDEEGQSFFEKIITKVNDDTKVKQRLLDNLAKGLNVRVQLSNHINLCSRLQVLDAKDYLKAILQTNTILSEYELSRTLEIYIELGGCVNELTFVFEQFEPKRDLHWLLLERLAETDTIPNHIGRFLLQQTAEGVVDKTHTRLISLLVRVGRLEGLQFYVDHVKTNNQISSDDRLGDVKRLPAQGAAELLLGLLAYILSHDVQGDRFRDPLEVVAAYLSEAAVSQESVYCFVHGQLTVLLEANCHHPKYHTLKLSQINLEKEYYLQKTDYSTIAEIKPVLANYLL